MNEEMLDEGFIDSLRKIIGSDNSDLMDGIVKFFAQTLTLKKADRAASLEKMSKAFSDTYNSEFKNLEAAVANPSPETLAKASKSMAKLSGDFLRMIGLGAFAAVPIPGTGPATVLVAHALLKRVTGGKLGLIPPSTYQTFRKYQELSKPKTETKSFKEFRRG